MIFLFKKHNYDINRQECYLKLWLKAIKFISLYKILTLGVSFFSSVFSQ